MPDGVGNFVIMDAGRIRHSFLGLIIGTIIGMLLLTGEINRLKTERDQIRGQLAELNASIPRARAYTKEGIEQSHRRNIWPQPATIGSQKKAPYEITDDDRILLDALKVRRSKGEYVNQFEDPINRRMLKESIEKGVQILSAMNRTNLAPLFAQMGLSDERGELLQAHLSKINEAAMEVQSMHLQLQAARADYDKRVRSMLSPEDYEQYKLFEASGPARREYEHIQRFAERQNIRIPEDEREKLLGIIRQAEAYPKLSYLGPYDGMPVVAVGKENVLKNAETLLAQVSEGANRALRLAVEQGLSETNRDLLFKYYDQDVQNRIKEIEMIQDPLTEQRIKAEGERRAWEGMQAARQKSKQAPRPQSD